MYSVAVGSRVVTLTHLSANICSLGALNVTPSDETRVKSPSAYWSSALIAWALSASSVGIGMVLDESMCCVRGSGRRQVALSVGCDDESVHYSHGPPVGGLHALTLKRGRGVAYCVYV